MKGDKLSQIELRLDQLGLSLPDVPKAISAYIPEKQTCAIFALASLVEYVGKVIFRQ
jgi:hypothetical protein